ncbi:MAG: tetratricopeptide repeat protein [Firmicutes bacterium]|nr:tetratricopeptide repeat protein [Bacillota bacterium]
MKTGMTLGEKVRYLRKRLNLTQQELAGDDFTKSFISQIEKNEANPSLKSLYIIAERLNKPVSFFLDESVGVDELERSPKVDQLNLMGQSFTREKNWSQAINCFEEALSLCSATDFQRRATCLYNLGGALWQSSSAAAATGRLEEAAQEFQMAGDGTGLVNTYNLLGVIHAHRGQWNRSVEYLQQALELIDNREAADAYLRLRILTNLGLGLCFLGRYEESMDQLHRALELSDENTDYYKFGDLQMALGYIHKLRGEPEEALRATTRAADFLRAVGPPARLIDVYVNLAVIYRARNQPGDIEKGLDCLKEAEALVEEHGSNKNRANIHEEYGRLLAAQGDHRRAIAAYQTALTHQGEPARKTKLHLALAAAHQGIGDRDKAAWHLGQASLALKDIAPAEGDKDLAELYSDLGLFYREFGDAEQANVYLARSVELYRKLQ